MENSPEDPRPQSQLELVPLDGEWSGWQGVGSELEIIRNNESQKYKAFVLETEGNTKLLRLVWEGAPREATDYVYYSDQRLTQSTRVGEVVSHRHLLQPEDPKSYTPRYFDFGSPVSGVGLRIIQAIEQAATGQYRSVVLGAESAGDNKPRLTVNFLGEACIEGVGMRPPYDSHFLRPS